MKPFLGMVALVALLHGVTLGLAQAQNPGQPGKGDPKAGKAKAALLVNDPKAFQGYTLFSPMGGSKSYLIDMEGRVVQTWQGTGNPACAAYLLADGTILRPAVVGDAKAKGVAGAGGRLQEIAWDGTIVWDYQFPNAKDIAHHDAVKLPNGNVLAIITTEKSAKEASAAGYKGSGPVMADGLLEIKPRGKDAGEVVWQWSSWDHIIQDADAAKPNFGKPSANPGLVDINFTRDFFAVFSKAKEDPTKAKGGKGGKALDWNHFNGLAYNPELDQIILSVHSFSEFWIIDHGTTTAEAATHKGGKQGKGGDILYRWGNPIAYSAGTANDQQLFFQHNAQWIPAGLPGAGHVLVFNNGLGRPAGAFSTVDEIVLPVDAKGAYEYKPGTTFGPAKAVWSYTTDKKDDFYSVNISGAQRLPNGNTLICQGPQGTVIEVTPKNEVVWKYVNPDTGAAAKGPPGGDKKGDLKKGDPKDFTPTAFEQQKKDAGGQPPAKGGLAGLGGAGASLFRATRIAPDHPGLAGKKLTPGSTLEELLQKGGKGK